MGETAGFVFVEKRDYRKLHDTAFGRCLTLNVNNNLLVKPLFLLGLSTINALSRLIRKRRLSPHSMVVF
jgi:hypothetical protein